MGWWHSDETDAEGDGTETCEAVQFGMDYQKNLMSYWTTMGTISLNLKKRRKMKTDAPNYQNSEPTMVILNVHHCNDKTKVGKIPGTSCSCCGKTACSCYFCYNCGNCVPCKGHATNCS